MATLPNLGKFNNLINEIAPIKLQMLFKKLDRKYYSDIVKILKWSVLLQLAQLMITFILTYYFKKEDFGALSFLLSISTLFEMAMGLQYNTAAIVNERQNNALSLMLISVFIAIAFSLTILSGILFLYFFSHNLYNIINNYGIITALPFLIISNFIFNNGIILLKYFGKIKEINIFRAVYVAAMLLTKLFAALIFATLASLIYAHLIGIFIPCIYFIFKFRYSIIDTYNKITYTDLILLLKQNYRFPKYSIISNIINAAATISFPILITLFFGLHDNGIYYLTTTFIFQPLLLILQAISDIFLQKIKIGFYDSKQVLFEFIKGQQKIILKILISYLLLAFLFGEFLFKYLLPAHWVEIGKFIKFIAPYYIFTSIYSPFSIVADFMNKQRVLLVFNLSLFLFQFFIIYYLHTEFAFTFVILIISIVSAMHYGFINFYMLQKLKFYK